MKIEKGESTRSSGAARRSPSTAPSPRPTATTATRWCWRPIGRCLAEHHHFESVEAAIRDGVDIIPKVSVVRTWDRPRRMADTERGDQIRCEIRMLERLIEAYRNNDLRQSSPRPGALR